MVKIANCQLPMATAGIQRQRQWQWCHNRPPN